MHRNVKEPGGGYVMMLFKYMHLLICFGKRRGYCSWDLCLWKGDGDMMSVKGIKRLGDSSEKCVNVVV